MTATTPWSRVNRFSKLSCASLTLILFIAYAPPCERHKKNLGDVMCEARYYFKIYLYACIASPRSLNVRTRSTSEITLLRIHFRLRAQNSELLKHVNHPLTMHQFESLPRAIFHIQFSSVSLMEFNFSATFNWRGWMRLESCENPLKCISHPILEPPSDN